MYYNVKLGLGNKCDVMLIYINALFRVIIYKNFIHHKKYAYILCSSFHLNNNYF